MIRRAFFAFLIALLFCTSAGATVVSRLALDHPAVGAVGGAGLHAAIEALYVKIGNNITSRILVATNLNDGATATVEHDLLTDFANISYDLYLYDEGTTELSKITQATSPALSDFAVAATSGFLKSKIDITNNSGAQRDLAIVLSIAPGSAGASGATGSVQFASGGAFASDHSSFFWDNTSKFLGIGTSTPARALQVESGSIVVSSFNGSNGTSTAVDLNSTNGGGTASAILRMLNGGQGWITGFDGADSAKFKIEAATGGSFGSGTLAIAAKQTGEVGIGTATPGEKLEVAGNLLLKNASGAQPKLKLTEDPDNGTDAVSLQVPASLTAPYTLTLPDDDGTSGYVLSTDGAGVLSWVSTGGGATAIGSAVTSGTTGSLLFVGAGPVLAQNNSKLFWDATNFRLGLGTATPNEQLELTGNLRLALTSAIYLGTNLWLHNSGGANNVFVGIGANYANAASTDATGIGAGAIASSKSTVIGSGAGASLTGAGNQYHTFIGYRAGTNLETGGVNVTGGNDSIAVGDGAGFDTATPSNSVSIGPVTIGHSPNIVTLGNYGHVEWVFGSDMFSSGASVARTWRGGNALGSDRAAGDISIQASRSTGSGTSGKLIFKAAPSASTGSSLNTVQTLVTMDPGTTSVGSTVTVKGQATQTNPIVTFENNAGTDLFNVYATNTDIMASPLYHSGTRLLHFTGASTNLFLGDDSGTLSTTTANSTAMGYHALTAITSGAQNVAIGSQAGAASTIALENVFVGYKAGDAFTSSQGMVLIGHNAQAYANTNASGVAIGKSAVTNDLGVAIGKSAYGGTAAGNVVIGGEAGNTGFTGTDSVFIGRLAGVLLTGADRNVVIGYNTGTAGANGDDNTMIGANANVGNFSHSTAIGAGSLASNDYSIVLGSAGDHVGIGDSTPDAKLDVQGDADEVQARIEGYSSQAADILLVEKQDGTDLLRTTNVNGTHIKGTTTNDAAAAGFVGETFSGSLVRSSANGLADSVTENVDGATALALTAGDWDIHGVCGFTTTTSTVTSFDCAVATTSATMPATDTIAVPTVGEFRNTDTVNFTLTSAEKSYPIPTYRLSISSTTTVYLVARAAFSAGSVSAFGSIQARRVR